MALNVRFIMKSKGRNGKKLFCWKGTPNSYSKQNWQERTLFCNDFTFLYIHCYILIKSEIAEMTQKYYSIYSVVYSFVTPTKKIWKANWCMRNLLLLFNMLVFRKIFTKMAIFFSNFNAWIYIFKIWVKTYLKFLFRHLIKNVKIFITYYLLYSEC